MGVAQKGDAHSHAVRRQGGLGMAVMTTVTVTGMLTEHCKRAVFTSLSGLAGITSAQVELGIVIVEHDGSITPHALRDAISVAGYTVTDCVESETRRTLPLVQP